VKVTTGTSSLYDCLMSYSNQPDHSQGVILQTLSDSDARFIAQAPSDIEALLELAMAVRTCHEDADHVVPEHRATALRLLAKIEDSG
jgi:hypothetical protein